VTATRIPEQVAPAPLLDFTGDNVAPVAQEIIVALAAANDGYAAPYGGDPLSERLSEAIAPFMFLSLAEGETSAFAVSSGVAANALALAAMTAPGGKVFCHEHAHIRISEHGAPEHQTGCELVPIDDDGNGRITPAALEAALAQHGPSPDSALSLTNLTEAGTVYSAAEVAALTRVARQHGVSVHLDGARLANATVSLGGEDPLEAGRALASLTWRAGVDAVSLGLTKNGGMSADAVVFFDARIAARFAELRARGGQRSSKMRFLSAQVLAAIESNGWVHRAANANRMARSLAAELSLAAPDVAIVRPVEGNLVFARLDAAHQARLGRAGFCPYAWTRFGDGVVRLVTNWTTTSEQVERLVQTLAGAHDEP
jgi:threonine aldolase